jgi:hypothetical protein
MVARESICLRRLAGGRRGGIVGFSRFLANPRVTVEALIAGLGEEIAEACAGRHVLAIQDTSEINFTTTQQRDRGLGEIGKGVGRGLLLHAMLGLDAETGGILGLASGRIWTRHGRVATPHQRPSRQPRSRPCMRGCPNWKEKQRCKRTRIRPTRSPGPHGSLLSSAAGTAIQIQTSRADNLQARTRILPIHRSRMEAPRCMNRLAPTRGMTGCSGAGGPG